MSVSSGTTGAQLKQRFSEIYGVDPKDMKLVIGLVEVADSKTLADLKVSPDTSITMLNVNDRNPAVKTNSAPNFLHNPDSVLPDPKAQHLR